MPTFNTAPLPFQGQKRNFLRAYRQLLATLPDDAIFVDLFGGSGLLSHTTRAVKPNTTVVYNDFDNYRQRIDAIPATNALLDRIRHIVADIPRYTRLPKDVSASILDLIIEADAQGFVDYITLSASLLFSSNFVSTLEELSHKTFYNRVSLSRYTAEGYLDGLTITSCDYRELFEQYKDNPNAIFLLDPPYLSTGTTTYAMQWTLADYLDVLSVLNGYRYIYFTSNKSHIIELCEWMGRNLPLGNPFADAIKHEHATTLNYNSGYTDIMLAKVA